MSPGAPRIPALLATLALLASVVTVIGVAAPSPADAAVVSTNSDPDYATVEFSDPWDFSNAADFTVQGAHNLKSWNIANGVLDAQLNQGGGLILAETIAGAMPLGRSTTKHPIKADSLRKVSFRMWSGSDQHRNGGFFWYTCNHIVPTCENGFSYQVRQGWNTYEFDIPSQPTFRGTPAWAGTIKGLRFTAAGGGPNHIFLDWFRLIPSAVSSAPPSPVVPLPVVDSPSVAGGIDYATLVRQNPWDMNGPDDIRATANMAYGFSNGVLNGINGGAHPDDASVGLATNGAIDGNRFHRLTFRVHYSGPFGLGAAPGGGMLARLIWQPASAPAAWQDSEDMVVFPGWNTVSVDLATNPPSAITDTNTPFRIGWAGQQIAALRFDPHEDSGARRFLIDDIRIAEDATGYGGTYDIKFHDNAWRAGTTADLYVTSTRGGFGGTQIAADLPVAQGTNTFRWAPTPIPQGYRWVYVVLKRGAYEARAYATGPLRMTASPSPLFGVHPHGALEVLSAGSAGVRAKGWALDPDTTDPIKVHFWVDGKSSVGSVTADRTRNDVAQKFAGYGSAHGYDTVIPVPQGTHSVCAHAINVGAGGNRVLGCRTVTVRVNPFGALDVVSAKVGHAAIKGWAIDPNRIGPIGVHVYVDGKPFTALTADRTRRDIGQAYPSYGEDHGYTATLKLPSGRRTICVYGINEGPGANAALGCKAVTLPANPFGSLDSVTRTAGGLRVKGWAIDPDTKAPISVHLYVSGGGVHSVVADVSHRDLIPKYGYGGAHGFDRTVPAGSGARTVCAYGINRGPGANTLLGCRST